MAPDNAEALAQGLRRAIALGPPTPAERAQAAAEFTLGRSVDELLAMFARPLPVTPAIIVRELEAIALLPAARTIRPPQIEALPAL